MMLLLTIRTSFITNYVNQSIPKEMIVYTQTTPELLDVLSFIETTSEITSEGKNIPLIIDQTNGFTWPWIWYLRDYQNVSYPSGYGLGMLKFVQRKMQLTRPTNKGEVIHAVESAGSRK